MAAPGQFLLVLLFISTLNLQSLAQLQSCELITESELGSTTTHSQDGVIPNVLATGGGNNPDKPFILIRGYRITCSVTGTAPDTYQYLSVVVAFSCLNPGLVPCNSVSSVLDGEGNFTMQFELRCTENLLWERAGNIVGISDTVSNPANGNLLTQHDRGCGLCLSNNEATRRLQASVQYNTESHCASCDSSCLSQGSGQCTDLGPGACCPFHVHNNLGSGPMCVDECPSGTLPNNSSSLCLMQESDVTDTSSTTFSPTVSPKPSCSPAWSVTGTIIAVAVFLEALVLTTLITVIFLQKRSLRRLRQEIEKMRLEFPMDESTYEDMEFPMDESTYEDMEVPMDESTYEDMGVPMDESAHDDVKVQPPVYN